MWWVGGESGAGIGVAGDVRMLSSLCVNARSI